jgi:outer membrane immunogenic protein
MKKRILLGATVLVGMIATSVVHADDLALLYKGPPAPVVTPTWSWTGLYVGGYVGVGWGRNDWSNFDVLGHPVASVSFGSYNVDSFLAGGKIGSNWQSSRLVFGVEADASAFDAKGSGPCSDCSSKTIGTVTGRVGVTIDHTLFYLKGGGAWMQ